MVRRERNLAPDPPRESFRYPIFSVDDHLLEPPDTFMGRLPEKYAARTPRVVQDSDGTDMWLLDDVGVKIGSSNADISWAHDDRALLELRFDAIRPGTFRVADRIRDMDICGIRASLSFPSAVFGFAGWRFARFKDPDFALACVRAYNDWVLTDWCGADPERLVPCQVPWLLDAEVAAEEIRRNAARGFHAVSFSENPERLGLPSIYTGYWDPFFSACEETGTVVNLHVGSSSQVTTPSTQSPQLVIAALFPLNAISAIVDWTFALVPVKFPALKICLSEGGIGWLPMLFDRLAFLEKHRPVTNDGGLGAVWYGDLRPAEVVLRNFYFAMFYDPISLTHLHELGVQKNVMVEVDYPHGDSIWPNAQRILGDQLDTLDPETARGLAWENAATLYQHPIDVFSRH